MLELFPLEPREAALVKCTDGGLVIKGPEFEAQLSYPLLVVRSEVSHSPKFPAR